MWRRPGLLRSGLLLLLAGFLGGLALTVVPETHAAVHSDPEHQCLATLITDGALEQTPMAHPAWTSRPWQAATASAVAEDCFVEALFRQASLLEHAPPVLS